MWLVEDWGVDQFREMIEQQMGDKLAKGVRTRPALVHWRQVLVLATCQQHVCKQLTENLWRTASGYDSWKHLGSH